MLEVTWYISPAVPGLLSCLAAKLRSVQRSGSVPSAPRFRISEDFGSIDVLEAQKVWWKGLGRRYWVCAEIGHVCNHL